MNTFWDHGVKTTLSDIEATTGLNRSSLYNSFGNKEDLFRHAMLCYVDFLEEWTCKYFNHLSFKDFLKAILDDAANQNFDGRGCFFYNCIGSAEKFNLKTKEILDFTYIRIRNIWENRILLAQQKKQLNPEIPSLAYASLIMATIAGLRSFNQAGFPKEDLQKASALALAHLLSSKV